MRTHKTNLSSASTFVLTASHLLPENPQFYLLVPKATEKSISLGPVENFERQHLQANSEDMANTAWRSYTMGHEAPSHDTCLSKHLLCEHSSQ
jgi:hypothetical protein